MTALGIHYKKAEQLLDQYGSVRKAIDNYNGWVCGLGHGINKNTPEKNVHLFIETIRNKFK